MRIKSGLTGKMMIYTATIGLAVWFISDTYQTRTLKEIFNEKLEKRFSLQAQEHRTLFDRYVKIHSQAAKLMARSDSLYHYIIDQKWQAEFDGKVIYYEDSPAGCRILPPYASLSCLAIPSLWILKIVPVSCITGMASCHHSM